MYITSIVAALVDDRMLHGAEGLRCDRTSKA